VAFSVCRKSPVKLGFFDRLSAPGYPGALSILGQLSDEGAVIRVLPQIAGIQIAPGQEKSVI